MTRQLRAILKKELRQNATLFLIMGVVMTALTYLLSVGSAANENTVTVLEIVPVGLLLYVPVASVYLSKRLFVSEQESNTHLFLEALPIARWPMYLVKYLLSLTFLGGSVLLMLAVVLKQTIKTEPVDSYMIWLLVCRALGYSFFIWSLCFAAGFGGRFRTTILWTTLLVAVGVGSSTSIPLDELGPLALVSTSDLPFNKWEFPWEPLLKALGLGMLLTGLGFAVCLWRDGLLARRLSGRMSVLEKSAGGVLVLLIITGFNLADFRMAKEPFEFYEEFVLKSEKTPLSILYLEPEHKERAEALMTYLEPKIAKLEQEVLSSTPPALNISLHPSFDGRTFDLATLKENDGILWRCAFHRDDFREDEFAAELVHSILVRSTNGLATFDPEHWFLDGFSVWWVEPESAERLWLASWIANRNELDVERLEGWGVLSDQLGWTAASSLAYSAVVQLERKGGPEGVVRLARHLYSTPYPRDVRAAFVKLRRPLWSELEEITKLSPAQFVTDWKESLQSGFEADRSSYPDVSAELSAQSDELRVRVVSKDPPASGTSWSFSHQLLPAYDRAVRPQDSKKEEFVWPAEEKSDEESLLDEYSSGQRVHLLVELNLPDHRFELPLLCERMELTR